MSDVKRKLNMMNIEYVELNDWSIQFNSSKDKVKIANIYLDKASEDAYDLIYSNQVFVFAALSMQIPTSAEEKAVYMVDIYIREKEKHVLRIKTFEHDITADSRIISLYDADEDNYVIINEHGDSIRLNRNDQNILKGREGDLAITTYSPTQIAISIENYHSEIRSKNIKLKNSKLIAVVNEQLEIQFK